MTKRKLINFLILIPMIFLFASCQGETRVQDGYLRDTIFSVEEAINGSYRVWFTHDDIAGYCTDDKELGEMALSLLDEHDGEVIAQFMYIGRGSPEWDFWHPSKCGTIYNGESSTAMFRLLDLKAVNGR